MRWSLCLAALGAALLSGCAAEAPYYGPGYYGYYDPGPGYYYGPDYDYYGPGYFNFYYRNYSSPRRSFQAPPQAGVTPSPAPSFGSAHRPSRSALRQRREERREQESAREAARGRHAHLAQGSPAEREHGG